MSGEHHPTSPTGGHAAGERGGEFIGPYRLLQVIGEGGFGVVYLAERRTPMVQRVAIKVIKPGMDSKAVIARFEQERQALAVMDHPNVARVLDAGTTDAGRPYFVMEHVRGEAITDFADRHRLSIRERLELFIRVCEAVQHAHHKGIIHRDLKPSNVLVSFLESNERAGSHQSGGIATACVVKVIDFGVAKAISHTFTDKTLFTESGQLIGTPEYMSPEQAEMGAVDIDTRTDVYSLGVLLYELLVGVTPFAAAELRSRGLDEIRRIIREEDPPRPSTQLTSDHSSLCAGRRATNPEELGRKLRTELDWIPLTAMRKNRSERYQSPLELANEVRAYIDGRPIKAAPESITYRVRKFTRKHALPVTIAAGFLGLLVAGIVGTSLGLVREARARTQAEAARDQAERARASESEAKALAQANARDAQAAREQAETALQRQRVATARLLIRQREYTRAAELLRSVPETPATSAARRWAAWELCRASRELANIDLREKFPEGVLRISARTVGNARASFDAARRIVQIQPGDAAEPFDIPLPAIGWNGPAITIPFQAGSPMPEVSTDVDTSGRSRQRTVLAASFERGAQPVWKREFPQGITALAAMPAHNLAAVGLTSGRIVLLHWKDGAFEEVAVFDTGVEGVQAMLGDSAAGVLYAVTGDWRLRAFALSESPDVEVLSLHRLTTRRAVASPDGRWYATAAYGAEAALIRAEDGRVERVFRVAPKTSLLDFRAGGISFLNERSLVIAPFFSKALLWDTTSEPPGRAIGTCGSATNVATDPSGRWIAIGGYVEGNTTRGEYRLEIAPAPEFTPYELESRPTEFLYALAASPDGKTLVAAWTPDTSDTPESEITIYDVAGRRRSAGVRLPGTFARDVAVSPSGDRAALATRAGTVEIFDLPGLTPAGSLPVNPGNAHTNIVSSVRFHPHKPLLVTASHSNAVAFWDTQNREELGAMNVDPSGSRGYNIGFLKAATFTPDGRRLLVAQGDDRSGELLIVHMEAWEERIRSLLGAQ